MCKKVERYKQHCEEHNQCVALFPTEPFAQEQDDGLETVACCDPVAILLHDRRATNSLEQNSDCQK